MNTPVPPAGGKIDRAALPALFAPRGADTHKGSFGTVGVVGGGPGMTGAALLAARAALKTGAGKVLVGFAQDAAPLACDPLQLELMLRDARSLLEEDWGVTAWVAGCGIGTGTLAANVLSELFVLRRGAPLVLDADGLNLLARGEIQPGWGEGPVVLTPHPAEAGRLLGAGAGAADVQADRPGAARELARRYGAWIVLKGAGTVVCPPQGELRTNTSGNPGLATAGTGDVLAGMLGSLIAQKLPLNQAVAGAVWLHGAAADALVARGVGPIGLTAGELADAARELRNRG
ncbi:NAD(P)H-hydrate dehydratase [Achromobacter denitrificans]|uniref:NAD(P)H-hydrate dehydratase n=1 Tax=Achromobacter denitrificans TaxID=32002 RepID=UPI003D011E6E